MNLNTVPKMGPPGGPIFLGPHAQQSKRTVKQQEKHFHGPIFGTVWRYLSKKTKEKHFHGLIFGTVWRYQKWDRKIAKSTAKADPCNEQKMTTAFS